MKMENNHMNEGTGEDSYANNSLIQAWAISKLFPIIREALEELYTTMLPKPKCVMVGELGCASGPNTLMMIPEIIDITYEKYRAMNYSEEEIPEIKVFLNDLPSNDYNTIASSLPSFYKQLEEQREGDVGPCFISITPGSFHKRVFPTNFLHFVHCSNSVHWLSQVPKGLVSKSGELLNKGNIYISETSPPEVVDAYREQFQEDFMSFLESRGKEIVTGGRMVISIMATTPTQSPQDHFMLKALNTALQDMATQGLIDGKKLDEAEIPFYPPTTEEVKRVIEAEGSFCLHKHEIFTIEWDFPPKKIIIGDEDLDDYNKDDNDVVYVRESAKFAAAHVRVCVEYLTATQFGEHLMDDLYSRVTELVAKCLEVGKLETFHHAISLIKN